MTQEHSARDTTFRRLRAALGQLGLEPERTSPLGGDVSSRRYFRLWLKGRTLVACVYPEPFDPNERPLDRWQRLCASDPEFRMGFASDPVAYLETTAWFVALGIPVPAVEGVVGDLGCIVLDDVGDLSLERALHAMDSDEIRRVYARALDYLGRLQRSSDAARAKGVLGSRLRLDQEKLTHELCLLARSMTPWVIDYLDETTLTALRGEWHSVAVLAAAGETVLNHRDYHARNLYLQGDEVIVLDHQDMRLGNRLYDVVSLLWDPYVALPDALRWDLLSGLGISRGPHVAAVACQRLLKALGTYLNVLRTVPNTVFATAAMRAMRSLDMFFGDLEKPLPATRDIMSVMDHEVRTWFGTFSRRRTSMADPEGPMAPKGGDHGG